MIIFQYLTMLIFFISFILMLICGSIFILGFHTITRGKELILPDGTKEIEKEIFGDWQLFWEQIIRYNKVFYSGEQLKDKLKILEQLKPAYMEDISVLADTEKSKSLIFEIPPTAAQVRDIEFSLNVKSIQKGEILFIYDEFPIYKFSEWIRKITNCHVCLSSWMGTLFYWTITYFHNDLFILAVHPMICKVFFWVVYCVSLAFLNKVIKENFDEEKK